MARKRATGPCHICGEDGDLSFEHVPPRAAFNDRPLINPDITKVIGTDDPDAFENLRGRKARRGAGAYTLCERCNKTTGGWYGPAYVEWVSQGLTLLAASSGSPSLYHIFHIFPLRVLKQIVCMFFSANGPQFRDVHPSLVRFVLSREARWLDPKVRIFVFYTMSNRSRQSGVSVLGRLSDDGTSVQTKVFSEITFPPFGFILALDSPPPDHALFDISFFAEYRYNDWRDVQLRLPAREIYSPLPGDYRSRDEIREVLRRDQS